jgi:hypothetical protein
MSIESLSQEQRARLASRSAWRHSDFGDVALPPLPAVPGMVTDSECRYLYWLTSRGYAGAGAVVEVGTWLGRSTIHLAAGLRDAGFAAALHCYDQFVWRSDHARKSALPLRRGDDFQPYFERNVRPVYPGLRVTKAPLQDAAWTGGPIEILFLDAPKHLADFSSALAAFGPSLVPRIGLLVLQDYLHSPAYALAAVVSRLGDALQPLHIVAGGCTMAFAVPRPLDFGLAQPIDWNFSRWSPEEIVASWARAADPLPPEARARLWVGAALLLYRRRETAKARAIARRLGLDPELRPHLERHAAALLHDGYRPLFRAAGIPAPPRARRPAASFRQAIRRARAFARRWLRPGDPARSIG